MPRKTTSTLDSFDTDAVLETRAALEKALAGISIAGWLRDVGLPKAFSASVSYARRGAILGKVSDERHNQIRRALGLQPLPVYKLAKACPTCGIVHGEGIDCKGGSLQFIIKQRRDLRPVAPWVVLAALALKALALSCPDVWKEDGKGLRLV